MFRVLRPYQVVVDCLLAVAYFFVVVAAGTVTGFAVLLLVALLTIALLLRRLAPGIALALSWAAALAQMYVVGAEPGPLDFAILAVVYSTAAYGNRPVKFLGLGSVGIGALLGSLFLTLGNTGFLFGTSVGVGVPELVLRFLFQFVAMLVLLGLPWTVGQLVRARMAARQSREAELAAQAEAELAEREVIVEQERNRIARDMHDVVAHSLAVVIAQADGARYVKASDPTAVDQALNAISSTAREALADVRLLLGQLRHNQGAGPQPALEDLDRLLQQMRSSGLAVRFEERGSTLGLATGQQLAVYRIVQEALTNVLRHGDIGKPVELLFHWTTTDLEVTISSSLLASPRTGELRLGHGIAGMRERAALAGGRLTAEAGDTLFVVMAALPAAKAVRV